MSVYRYRGDFVGFYPTCTALKAGRSPSTVTLSDDVPPAQRKRRCEVNKLTREIHRMSMVTFMSGNMLFFVSLRRGRSEGLQPGTSTK